MKAGVFKQLEFWRDNAEKISDSVNEQFHIALAAESELAKKWTHASCVISQVVVVLQVVSLESLNGTGLIRVSELLKQAEEVLADLAVAAEKSKT